MAPHRKCLKSLFSLNDTSQEPYVWRDIKLTSSLVYYRPHSEGMGKVMFSQASVSPHPGGGYPVWMTGGTPTLLDGGGGGGTPILGQETEQHSGLSCSILGLGRPKYFINMSVIIIFCFTDCCLGGSPGWDSRIHTRLDFLHCPSLVVK